MKHLSSFPRRLLPYLTHHASSEETYIKVEFNNKSLEPTMSNDKMFNIYLFTQS